jgi:hypothetical protein
VRVVEEGADRDAEAWAMRTMFEARGSTSARSMRATASSWTLALDKIVIAA